MNFGYWIPTSWIFHVWWPQVQSRTDCNHCVVLREISLRHDNTFQAFVLGVNQTVLCWFAVNKVHNSTKMAYVDPFEGLQKPAGLCFCSKYMLHGANSIRTKVLNGTQTIFYSLWKHLKLWIEASEELVALYFICKTLYKFEPRNWTNKMPLL